MQISSRSENRSEMLAELIDKFSQLSQDSKETTFPLVQLYMSANASCVIPSEALTSLTNKAISDLGFADAFSIYETL